VRLHELLEVVHRAYRPRSYLEIGVNTGRSLALSRTRTIGVDPAFKITAEVQCDLKLVKATSDDFFARDDALAHFPDGRIDLAFVDGLHLIEFALRDFMNVERHSDWTSVIVVDDVLPRDVGEAARDRAGRVAWAGDVFKLAEVLGKHRPDLLVLPLDTDPTGVLLVLGADRESRVLQDRYDEIVAEYVYPDPQRVPEVVLRRETAIEPASIAHSEIWTELRGARESGLSQDEAWSELLRSVKATARRAAPRDLSPATEPPGADPGRNATIERPPGPETRALRAVRRRLRPVRRRARRLVSKASGWAR
jgi:predicted O-methyltransferase YrrM